MKDRYPHLMHLDAKQLHNYLAKRYAKVQPLVREGIYKTVREQQMRRANNGRREAQVDKWWSAIMTEAQREKLSVRSSLAHDKDNAQRQEVFNAYYAVIKRALETIKTYKARKLTPNMAQEERKAQGKQPYPNDLKHWSDLVPEKIRTAITQAFYDLPHKPKGKRKVPFIRETYDNWGEQ